MSYETGPADAEWYAELDRARREDRKREWQPGVSSDWPPCRSRLCGHPVEGKTACAYCGGGIGKGRRRFGCDFCQQKGRAAERVREPAEYTQALLRMLRTVSSRAGFDAAAFGALVELDRELPDILAGLARQLLGAGFSWGDIGRACGMSRQAARQRWGRT